MLFMHAQVWVGDKRREGGGERMLWSALMFRQGCSDLTWSDTWIAVFFPGSWTGSGQTLIH